MPKVRLGQIGTLVRERRGTQGIRTTAREIGVSPATLSRVENGKQPDLTTFEKLCRWLEINPSDFLNVGTTDAEMPEATVSTATAHLRAQRQITPELAQALGEMIVRAQEMLADEPEADSSG